LGERKGAAEKGLAKIKLRFETTASVANILAVRCGLPLTKRKVKAIGGYNNENNLIQCDNT